MNDIRGRLLVSVHLSETPKREPFTAMGATRTDGVAALDVVPHWTCAEGLYAHVYARAQGPEEYQEASEKAQKMATAFAEAKDGHFAWAAQISD